MIASLTYLVYSLYTFKDYDLLMSVWQDILPRHYFRLMFVVLLLPVNWGIESLKWQQVARHVGQIKFREAFSGVLAGLATGFGTPNRIGDIIGRITFIHPGQRTGAVGLAAINSLTQNIAILIAGIPSAILFFLQSGQQGNIHPGLISIVFPAILVAFLLALYYLPAWAARVKSLRWKKYLDGIAGYSRKDLLSITLLSLGRFIISNIQLYLLLRFSGVELSLAEAAMTIPANYLFVTFTPSVAFSEGMIRSSWALFFISRFSPNTPGIIVAGAGLWLINIVIPVIAGHLILLFGKKKPGPNQPV